MPAKAKDENTRTKLLRKVFERIKESKWGTSYKSMRIKHPWNKSYFLYDSELARTFESKNHIRIKLTSHRVNKKCFALGRNITRECLLSQPVLYQLLNAFQCWCLKKMFNGEIICHLKRRLRRLFYHKWKAWYKLLSSSGLKKKLAIFFIIHQSSFERDTKYCHWAPSIV